MQNPYRRTSGPLTDELIIETGSQMVTGNRAANFGRSGADSNGNSLQHSRGDGQARGKG